MQFEKSWKVESVEKGKDGKDQCVHERAKDIMVRNAVYSAVSPAGVLSTALLVGDIGRDESKYDEGEADAAVAVLACTQIVCIEAVGMRKP